MAKKINSGSDTIKRKTKNKKKPAPRPEVYKRKWGNQYSLKYTKTEIEKLADRMVDFFNQDKNAFYFTDFTSSEMINRQRIYEFVKTNDYFRYCYEMVKGIIISRFIKFGIGGKNAVFPMFGLTNIAGDEFKHKQDLNVKSFDVDLSKFTEKGLHRLINGEEPSIVILDPESVILPNQ